MALISPPTTINQIDGEVSFQAASAGGDTFAADGRTFLIIENTSGAARVVQIAAVITGLQVPGFGDLLVIAIGIGFAGDGIGLLQPTLKSHTVDGVATVTVDTEAGVGYAVRRLNNP